jgi:hypothetical protein
MTPQGPALFYIKPSMERPRRILINIRQSVILPDHRWGFRNFAAMFRALNWSIPNVGVRTANTNATIPIQEWKTLKCALSVRVI